LSQLSNLLQICNYFTLQRICVPMSNLYRSAISARASKLPQTLPDIPTNLEDEEDEEEIGTIGELPGSGLGPPAMQV